MSSATKADVAAATPMAASASLERRKARIEGRRGEVPLTFVLREGERASTTVGSGAPVLTISILSDAGRSAVRSLSELAIAEAYMNGDIDIDGDLLDAMKLRSLMSNYSPSARLGSVEAAARRAQALQPGMDRQALRRRKRAAHCDGLRPPDLYPRPVRR